MTELAGGYVRHRDRMIQASVFADLQDTLIACHWMAGTTTHAVVDMYDSGTRHIVTTTQDQVLKLLQGTDITLIDYFPDPEQQEDEKTVPKNTLAVDSGRTPDDPVPLELGSNTVEVAYVFNMAFYAISDAVAIAVYNDLRDRYEGRSVGYDAVDLYDYNTPDFDEDTPPVTRLEVVSFKFARDVEQAAPWELHLYFAELQLIDTRE